MMCYRDMSFCSDADECANKVGCSRWFSPEQFDKAAKWWGGEDAPVAFSSFKSTCNKWEETHDPR